MRIGSTQTSPGASSASRPETNTASKPLEAPKDKITIDMSGLDAPLYVLKGGAKGALAPMKYTVPMMLISSLAGYVGGTGAAVVVGAATGMVLGWQVGTPLNYLDDEKLNTAWRTGGALITGAAGAAAGALSGGDFTGAAMMFGAVSGASALYHGITSAMEYDKKHPEA